MTHRRSGARGAAAAGLLLALLASCNRIPATPSKTCEAPLSKHCLVDGGPGWTFHRGAISPDGSNVAFIADVESADGNRLGLARAGKPEFISPAGVEIGEFAWMPDSRTILVGYHAKLADPLDIVEDKLGVMDLSGKIVREIRVNRRFAAEDGGMAVRRDGAKALIGMTPPHNKITPADLVEVDLASGAARTIGKATPDLSEFSPVYLDENRAIVSVALSEASEERNYLAAVDLRAGTYERITGTDIVTGSATARWNAPEIVFDAYPSSDRRESRGLYVMPANGGTPRRFLSLDAREPSIAPSGREVLVSVVGSVGDPGPLRLVDVTA